MALTRCARSTTAAPPPDTLKRLGQAETPISFLCRFPEAALTSTYCNRGDTGVALPLVGPVLLPSELPTLGT